MIDVSGYIYKLEKLKEYIGLCVDRFGHPIWIDIDSLPRGFTTKEILDFFYQTGYLMETKYQSTEPPKRLSFNEWLSMPII